MNDFFNNIVRYPRFFVSSLIGLILVIITPFRNLLKIPKLRIVFLIGIILFISCLCLVLTSMTASWIRIRLEN